MMYAVLHLIATQPHLLADQVEAYTELVAAEIGKVAASWRRRALLNAVALCCLGVAAADALKVVVRPLAQRHPLGLVVGAFLLAGLLPSRSSNRGCRSAASGFHMSPI